MNTTETQTEAPVTTLENANINAAAESGEYYPRDNGANVPGQLYLANEARFNSAFFSEPLTAYATGWKDPNNLEALLDFVAPPVQVGRRFEFKRADNAEAFYSDTDDLRAPGGEFKYDLKANKSL